MDDLNTITAKRTSKGKKSPQKVSMLRTFLSSSLFKHLITLLIGSSLTLGAISLFKHCYYNKNQNFMVSPNEIHVSGNATLNKSYILQCFDITEPRNGYELLKSNIVQGLQTKMPILKNAQMTYRPGQSIELWVEERLPLARIAGDLRPPLVVDDEGVLFMYNRPTNLLPEIGGFDLPDAEMMPGKRLPSSLHCMLRLLMATTDAETTFNSAVKRVTLLGANPDDGLRVTLADGRKIEIAWDKMASETATSEDMIRRLRNISRVLKSPTSAGKMHINAMAIDRVSISE